MYFYIASIFKVPESFRGENLILSHFFFFSHVVCYNFVLIELRETFGLESVHAYVV